MLTDILRRVVFENDTVCCLCLKNTGYGENAFRIHDKVFLDNAHSHYTLDFYKIICSVFGNAISMHQFISNTVCEECCKSVLGAYKFIKKCLEINKTIANLICSLTKDVESTNIDNIQRAKGMFALVDPHSSQITTYFDSKKTVKSASLIIKRFQSLIGTKRTSNKRDCKTDHTRKITADKLDCKLCGKSCSNKYNLKNHLKKYCKNYKNNFDINGDDDDDDIGDNNVDDLFHLQNKNSAKRKSRNQIKNCQKFDITCEHCKQSFKSKCSVQIHIHNQCKNVPCEAKVSVCSQCGEVVDKMSMKLHEISHGIDLECLKCGKIFKTQKAYQKHLLIPNCNEKPEEFIHKPKEFSCHICGNQFHVKKSLNDHMKARHIGVGFPCAICQKKLATPYALRLHNLVHTKEKNFMCTICGGKFVSKHSLLYHTRTHTGEKPYKCKYCDDRFLSASRRNIHIRIHHLPPQLECKYCTRKFTNWGTLNKHRKRHFQPGSSLYLEELNFEAL